MIFNKKSAVDLIIDTPSKYYAENILEFIKPTEYPEWTKDIVKFSVLEHFKMAIETLRRKNSIQQCPAFIDIIKNSLSLYSPADMTIEVGSDGNWRYFTPWGKFKLTQHDLLNQMGPNNPISKNGVHFKLEPPFLIKASKKISVFFVQPMYHNFHDLMIVPGAISLNPKYNLQPNINVVVPYRNINGTKLIKIKKGDLLCYLYYGSNYKIGNIKTRLMSTNEEFTPESLCEISNFEKLTQ